MYYIVHSSTSWQHIIWWIESSYGILCKNSTMEKLMCFVRGTLGFESRLELHQGDGLSCLLFNIAHEFPQRSFSCLAPGRHRPCCAKLWDRGGNVHQAQDCSVTDRSSEGQNRKEEAPEMTTNDYHRLLITGVTNWRWSMNSCTRDRSWARITILIMRSRDAS